MRSAGDLRVVFLGTPEFAVPSLDMLLEEGYDVAAVITQPDRPKGRGHRLMAPPVKERSLAAGLPVWQPEKLRSPENTARLAEFGADLMITAAYGQILSEEVLAVPPCGCINVHASLLPAYRGAAPIVWSLINGEPVTGVTTMRTVRALDAGPILEQDALEVPAGMTGGELTAALSRLGAKTLSRTLAKLRDGTLAEREQDPEAASYYPVLPRGFGEIDWQQPAASVLNFVRALSPDPGAFIVLPDGERVRVLAASAAAGSGAPGQIMSADPGRGLLIGAADGLVSLDLIRRANGKTMPAADSLRGRPITAGFVGRAGGK